MSDYQRIDYTQFLSCYNWPCTVILSLDSFTVQPEMQNAYGEIYKPTHFLLSEQYTLASKLEASVLRSNLKIKMQILHEGIKGY